KLRARLRLDDRDLLGRKAEREPTLQQGAAHLARPGEKDRVRQIGEGAYLHRARGAHAMLRHSAERRKQGYAVCADCTVAGSNLCPASEWGTARRTWQVSRLWLPGRPHRDRPARTSIMPVARVKPRWGRPDSTGRWIRPGPAYRTWRHRAP